MPQQFIILIVAAVALLAIGGISFLSGRGSLDSIKSKPSGGKAKNYPKPRGWCWAPRGRRAKSPHW